MEITAIQAAQARAAAIEGALKALTDAGYGLWQQGSARFDHRCKAGFLSVIIPLEVTKCVPLNQNGAPDQAAPPECPLRIRQKGTGRGGLPG